MGYRHTFITTDRYSDKPIPLWFLQKYAGSIYLTSSFPLASCCERTWSDVWCDLLTDLQKAIIEMDISNITLVKLSEDSIACMYYITHNKIVESEYISIAEDS